MRFRYTDYRSNDASRHKTMTLAAAEFIRRMLLNVLPPGFYRIRYYGFLANRARQQKLAECRQGALHAAAASATAGPPVSDYRDRYEALTGRSLRQCPRCHAGNMQPVDRRLGVSGHSGFVVTSASTSARRASAAPGVAGAVLLRLRSSRWAADHLRGHRRQPPAAGNLPAPAQRIPASAVCPQCNTHRSPTAGWRFRPIHFSVTGAVNALPPSAGRRRAANRNALQAEVDYGEGPMVRDAASGKYRRTRLFDGS